MTSSPFLTSFAQDTFYRKYALTPSQSWADKCRAIVSDVCGANNVFRNPLMGKEDRRYLQHALENMWFLPGGRYIYYAGRKKRFWNNCLLLALEEDTREAWATLAFEGMSALMTGAGIGVDYSVARPEGSLLGGTGGVASGPVSLMLAMNENGRQVMQGGSRRSALYATLHWLHEDASKLLTVKDWDSQPLGLDSYTMGDLKRADFNAQAPLDMTNISLGYDDTLLEVVAANSGVLPKLFVDNVRYAMMNGEPGFSFNFFDKKKETLRNACTEITSEDSSDICNLGSINMARVPFEELSSVIDVATKFLVAGTVRAELPYDKVYEVREKNRRLGLGLMGVHEWLLKRGYKYEMNDELRDWMQIYKNQSRKSADSHCDRLYLSRPVACRAIAPTGTISILAGPTTSGVEPLFAQAYKRRFLEGGTVWKSQVVIDPVAQKLIEVDGVAPEAIETAADLAADPERRIKFQADMQKYVDHGISSTINLPQWGSELNNEDKVEDFAQMLWKHCTGLRGLTFYPDGARGGQPLTPITYLEAKDKVGTIIEESDQCKGGICGI